MSATEIGCTGALQSTRITFCSARWGGGAEPGKWHVYPLCGASILAPGGDWNSGLLQMSSNAVVDDFGNLVKVQS
jgi:hypothetical protein